MNRSRRLRLLPSTWVFLAVTLGTFALVPALAQAQLSSAGSSNSGSTCTGNSGDQFCGSSTSVLVNTGTTFQSRYAWNVNADTGIFSTADSSGTAQHNMSFNATAPGGYRLDIATSRSGDMNRVNDASGCDGSADVGGVAGSSNVAISSGNLNLGDPGSLGNGGSTTSTPFSQNGSATIFRVSNGAAQGHTLTFTWSGSARSNSCEAAVRIGQSNGTTTACSACEYPGSPSRTQSSDGHFVSVSYTSLCGNSVVDASVSEQCDQGAANGTTASCCSSTCQFKNNSNQCRASAGDCDIAEFCTGSSPTCPTNAFKGSSIECRGSAGACDIAENCTGSTATCPTDAFKSSSVECRGSAGDCDVAENCTGSGPACPADAFESSSVECRGSAGDCDVAENCTGSSAACPADDLVDAGTQCRGSAGPCDIAEACTGSGPSCPADAFQPAPGNQGAGATATQSSTDVGTADRAIDGNTDGDFANGSVSRTNAETEASWDADLGSVGGINTIEIWNTDDGTEGNLSAFYVFVSDNAFTGTTVSDSLNQAGVSAYYMPGQAARPSVIDVSRTGQFIRVQLTGGDALTLAEVRVLTGTVCRNAAGACDADDLCDGSGAACTANDDKQTVECRAAAGVCDVAESCDGVADDCPTDAFVSASTECRASAGDCDIAENCTGTDADCPADAFASASTECRAASDFCDLAENCTGTDADCPADALVPAGTECRPQNGACDVAEACDGVSTACPADAVATSAALCRGLQGACDVAENCDGVSTTCPADVVLPNASVCRPSAGDCDPQETCDGVSPLCPANSFSSNSTVCRPSTGDCDVADTCTGSSATCPADAVAPNTQVCRPSADQCDPAETCDGISKPCPADVLSQDSDSDGACDLIDNCVSDPNGTQVDSDGDGEGDACDPCTNTGSSFATRRKITVKKILAPTGDDRLVIKGQVNLPALPTVNPLANGVRILLENATPSQMLDVIIPGGAYDPLNRIGWRVNGAGNRWSYKNGSPTPANPISGVKISKGAGNVYKITVKGKNGNLPVLVGEIPLKATVVIDSPTAETGQCGEWTFPSAASCRFAGSFSTVNCK